MSDHRTEFLAQLQLFDEQLKAGQFKKVKLTLRALDELLGQLVGPDGDRARAVVDAQRSRLTAARARAKLREALRPRRPRRTNARCSLCGQPYRRVKGDDRRTACYICKPLMKASKSVRAVSGGLPSLGKRVR